MKFGKKLAAEAARRWTDAYFDYKAVKRAISEDIASADAAGSHVREVLQQELRKLSTFYSEHVAQLEGVMGDLAAAGAPAAAEGRLQQLRSEVQELIKFTALNYLAVVKAIKKRNRHLQESLGAAAGPALHALDLLGGEEFFTSTRLARLATQAEVLHKRASASADGGAKDRATAHMLEEYQCPICLDTLHGPVVLTCAHRFCWGCLVAHSTTSRGVHAVPGKLGLEVDRVPLPATPYYVLEQLAIAEELEEAAHQAPYNCPLCRKPQLADVVHLQVDTHLSEFIEALKAANRIVPTPLSQPPAVEAAVQAALAAPPAPWGVIPPQAPHHQGKLTVLLDLDGTLVSSFTPRRAPRLPPSVVTHVVGKHSALNPAGVFVVERPGLDAFLQQLASWAEVIVFTAGLEDYAKPIIDAIDPHGIYFTARIYREGTLRTDHYQCVKDMARLNRDLRRTVLVDDTPLAFLHQPNNGVPVLGFRGDPDDRLLQEAVMPLLQTLEAEADVRVVLQRRFDMSTWFRRNGFPVDSIIQVAQAAADEEREAMAAQAVAAAAVAASAPVCSAYVTIRDTTPMSTTSSMSSPQASPPAHGGGGSVIGGLAMALASQQLLVKDVTRGLAEGATGAAAPPDVSGQPLLLVQEEVPPPRAGPVKPFLLLSDFDKTLTDFDIGELLIEHLAPELLPQLVNQQYPTEWIPITNTLLAELQRRGVSEAQVISTLREFGAAEMPAASLALLRAVTSAGVDIRVVSDANTFFIDQVLAGAGAVGLVQVFLTNPAAFEAVAVAAVAAGGTAADCDATAVIVAAAADAPAGAALVPGGDSSSVGGGSSSWALGGDKAAASHRLVVVPHHPKSGIPHRCTRCPTNLCKGAEVDKLRRAGEHDRIIYCGDGDNDVCAALRLGPRDVVLAREGFPLARYCRSAAQAGLPLPLADVRFWSSHEELCRGVCGVIGVAVPESVGSDDAAAVTVAPAAQE